MNEGFEIQRTDNRFSGHQKCSLQTLVEETIRQLDKEIEEWKMRVKEDKIQNLYHCPITLCAKKLMKSFLEEKIRKTKKNKNKIIGKFLTK